MDRIKSEDSRLKYKSFLDDFKNLFPNRKVLFLCESGSHFFDLNTKDSDRDFFGLYLPSKEELIKKKYKEQIKFQNEELFFEKGYLSQYMANTNLENKNSNEDVDFKMFSIFKFLELLKFADFNCMELLFCPDDKILIDSKEFSKIREIRNSLLKKDKRSFLGFIKREFRRGHENYENLLQLKDLIVKNKDKTKLKEICSEILLIDNNFISKKKLKEKEYISIYQSLFELTVSSKELLKWIENKISQASYRKTEKSNKMVCHSYRLLFEVEDLLTQGELKIPFSQERREFLLDLKTKKYDNKYVDDLFNRIEKINKISYKNNDKDVDYLIDKIYYTMKGKLELL